LDDRKKLQLLHVVQNYSSRLGLQYILTTIDADLPRDSKGEKLQFPDEVIVRRLHDRGDDGRLFRMPKF